MATWFSSFSFYTDLLAYYTFYLLVLYIGQWKETLGVKNVENKFIIQDSAARMLLWLRRNHVKKQLLIITNNYRRYYCRLPYCGLWVQMWRKIKISKQLPNQVGLMTTNSNVFNNAL